MAGVTACGLMAYSSSLPVLASALVMMPTSGPPTGRDLGKPIEERSFFLFQPDDGNRSGAKLQEEEGNDFAGEGARGLVVGG